MRLDSSSIQVTNVHLSIGVSMLKYGFLLTVIVFALLAGCAPRIDPTTPAPSQPDPTLPAIDLTPAQMIVSNVLAEALGLDVAEISFISTEAVDWPDGCLGAARPGMMCTQAIVPGFRIVMEADGLQYEYRTNQDGSQVVSASKFFSWTRSGGIAGFCDELAIYLPDEIAASDCKSGSVVDQLSVVANPKEREQLLKWMQTYAAQTLTRSDGAVADSMTVEIEFAGQGTEKVDASIEEEMFEMLGDIYARMMQ